MLSDLFVYLLSVLLMVLIYLGITSVTRIRPNSYLGELFQSTSGKFLAGLLSFVIFCIIGLIYSVYFTKMGC